MSNLLPELVTDILHRLPVKSLLRFRCVSKPLCSQIDDPHFIKLHLNHSLKTNTNLSLILRDSKLYTVDLDSHSPANAVELDHPLKSSAFKTEILGSCNGILALVNSNDNVALYNPSTRKYQKLPVSPTDFPGDICLAEYTFYGFGYDPINDDYKVVRMVHFYGDVDDGIFYPEVKVYSLKTNSWKKVFAIYSLRFIEQPDYCTRYKRGYGVYACGALHWKAPKKPEVNDTDMIVAFDLGVEEFRLVSLPDYYRDVDCELNVGVLGGCLCVLCNYEDLQVEIWVMKEYGVKESWTNMFCVITELQVQRFYLYVRPLAYSKSGDKVLLELDNRFFAWYDLKRRKGKNVKIDGVPDEFEVEICVGSLVPLNGRCRIDRKEQQVKVEMRQKKSKKRVLSWCCKPFGKDAE